MNQDSVLHMLQNPSVSIDTSNYQILNSVMDTIESRSSDSGAQLPKRFITEKGIVKYMPEHKDQIIVSEWITILLIGGFIFLAIVNFLFQKSLFQNFRAVFGKNHAHQLIREGNPFKKRSFLLSSFIYLISIPLMFYAVIEHYSTDEMNIEFGFTRYALLAAVLTGFFIYKTIFIQFTSALFKTQRQSFELLSNILIFNLVIGILVLPFISLYFYTQMDIFLLLACSVYAIGMMMRIYRELVVGMSSSIFSILHLFLYLCTLEFIPVVIIGKLVINTYMI